nr:hypothetical protein [uncultured Methanomethylovorans sp.]
MHKGWNAMFGNIVSKEIKDNIKVFENMAHKCYIWCDGNLKGNNTKFKTATCSSLNYRF